MNVYTYLKVSNGAIIPTYRSFIVTADNQDQAEQLVWASCKVDLSKIEPDIVLEIVQPEVKSRKTGYSVITFADEGQWLQYQSIAEFQS